jgi:hypothetical protein
MMRLRGQGAAPRGKYGLAGTPRGNNSEPEPRRNWPSKHRTRDHRGNWPSEHRMRAGRGEGQETAFRLPSFHRPSYFLTEQPVPGNISVPTGCQCGPTTAQQRGSFSPVQWGLLAMGRCPCSLAGERLDLDIRLLALVVQEWLSLLCPDV